MSETTSGAGPAAQEERAALDQAAVDQARRDEQVAHDNAAAATLAAEQQAEAERLAKDAIVRDATPPVTEAVDSSAAPPPEPEESTAHSNPDDATPEDTTAPPAPAPAAAAPDQTVVPPQVSVPQQEGHQDAAPPPGEPAAAPAATATSPQVEAPVPVDDDFIRKTADDIMRSAGMGSLMDATGPNAHVLVGGEGAASLNLTNYISNLRAAVEQTLMEERARMRQVPDPRPLVQAAVEQRVANEPEAERQHMAASIMDAIDSSVETANSPRRSAPGAEAPRAEEAPQAAAGPRANPTGAPAGYSFVVPSGMLSFGDAWQNGMTATARANAAEVERRRILRASDPMAVRSAEANRPVSAFAGMRGRLVSKARAMSAAVSSALFTASFKAHEFLTSPAVNKARKGALALSLGVVAGTGLMHAVPWVADHLASVAHTGAALPTVNLHESGVGMHDQFAAMGRAMASQDVNSMAAPAAANPLTQYASLSNDTANNFLNAAGKSAGVHYDFASMNLPSGHSPLQAAVDPGRYGVPSSLIDTGAVSLNTPTPGGLTTPHVAMAGLDHVGGRPPMPDIMPGVHDAAHVAPGQHSVQHVAGHHAGPAHHHVTTNDLNDLSLKDAQAGKTVTAEQIASLSDTPHAPAHHIPGHHAPEHHAVASAHHAAPAHHSVASAHHATPAHHSAPAHHSVADSTKAQDHLAAAVEKKDVIATAPAPQAVHQQALADTSHATPAAAAHTHHAATHTAQTAHPAATPATPAADSSFASQHTKKPDDGFNMHFVGDGVRDIHKGLNYASDGLKKFFGLDDPAPTQAVSPTPAPTPTPSSRGPSPS